MDATPSRIFIMIDNPIFSVYVAVYNDDEILCLLPLLGLSSDILENVCIYARFILFKQIPGCLICCIRSVKQILGGCGAEKNSLNQTRF